MRSIEADIGLPARLNIPQCRSISRLHGEQVRFLCAVIAGMFHCSKEVEVVSEVNGTSLQLVLLYRAQSYTLSF